MRYGNLKCDRGLCIFDIILWNYGSGNKFNADRNGETGKGFVGKKCKI